MTTTATPAEPVATIEIARIDAETILVPIKGVRPLIVHNFSQKAKQQMLATQRGNKPTKESRDPNADYESAFYRMEFGDGRKAFGFPAVAFKAATVSAARYFNKIKMTELRQWVFIDGELTPADNQPLVEIVGDPRMREDVVRLSGPTRNADLRYRPEFPDWSCTLRVTYVRSCISRSSVLSLIDAGGLGVGVGEWRPERKGDFGTYCVNPDVAIEVVDG